MQLQVAEMHCTEGIHGTADFEESTSSLRHHPSNPAWPRPPPPVHPNIDLLSHHTAVGQS